MARGAGRGGEAAAVGRRALTGIARRVSSHPLRAGGRWRSLVATGPDQVSQIEGARLGTGEHGSALVLLLVDDHFADRVAVKHMLPAGWHVIEAATGEEGLVRLAEARPHCVFVNSALPDMSGLRFLEEVQGLTHGEIVASVLMAAGEEGDLGIMAMKKGAVDFLAKERMSGDTLRRTLHFAIERVALKQELRRQREELERLATTDPLTGLYNRRFLAQRVEEEVRRARRYKTRLCMLMMDVDRFKSVNDGFGHPAGDEVIRRLGEAIRSNLRESDLAARYGGDEFCVVLPETSVHGAEEVAERIRRCVESMAIVLEGGATIRVTTSIGVCELGPNHQDGDQLNQTADAMLYDAKGRGRNTVAVLPAIPSPATLRRRRDTMSELA